MRQRRREAQTKGEKREKQETIHVMVASRLQRTSAAFARAVQDRSSAVFFIFLLILEPLLHWDWQRCRPLRLSHSIKRNKSQDHFATHEAEMQVVMTYVHWRCSLLLLLDRNAARCGNWSMHDRRNDRLDAFYG